LRIPGKILKCAVGVAVFVQMPWATAVAGGVPAIDKVLAARFGTAPPYEYAMVDLNGDGVPDAIVLLTGPEYCGSGGCNMVVLRGAKEAFFFVSSSTITRQPVRILQEARMGWRSLSVSVAGGGAKPGEVLMRFNGKRYPRNPTTQPYATASDLRDAATLEFKQ
jgi:hypothetical protein